MSLPTASSPLSVLCCPGWRLTRLGLHVHLLPSQSEGAHLALVSWEGGKAGPQGLWPGGALAVCGQQGDGQQVHVWGLTGQHMEGTAVVPVWGRPGWVTGMLRLDSPFSPSPTPSLRSASWGRRGCQQLCWGPGWAQTHQPPRSGVGVASAQAQCQPNPPPPSVRVRKGPSSSHRGAWPTAQHIGPKTRGAGPQPRPSVALCGCRPGEEPQPLLRGFCLYPVGLLYIPDE